MLRCSHVGLEEARPALVSFFVSDEDGSMSGRRTMLRLWYILD
jgi:hypothetical protein